MSTPLSRTSPRSRYLGLIAFALMLVIGTLALPIVGHASTYRAGFTVNTTGSDISDNMSVASFRTTIDSSIEGSLNVVAFTATIRGSIGGDVHVLSTRANLSADVSGSVYIAGGTVTINGPIAGDVFVSGGRVELGSDARVEGDVVLFAGLSGIDGTVGGKLYGSVLIYDQSGDVSGNVELQAERIDIGADASIGNDFRYQSQMNASVSGDATIGGQTQRTNSTPWSGVEPGALAPFGSMLRLVWSLVLASVLIAIVPRLMYRLAEIGRPMLPQTIWGVVGAVVIPVFATLAIVSVLGIPVGALLMILTVIGLYLSQIVVATTLGSYILPRSWRDGSRGVLLLAMVIGMIIIAILRMAPVPFLGIAVTIVVTAWGFGTILMLALDLSAGRLRASLGY